MLVLFSEFENKVKTLQRTVWLKVKRQDQNVWENETFLPNITDVNLRNAKNS